MIHTSHLTRCAPLAIAATLALGSTPLLAQDAATAPTVTAQPVIAVPDPAPAPPPAPAPAPAIVIPQELTQPQAAAPAPQQPVATTAAAAPRPATTRPAPRAVAPLAAAPEPAPLVDAEPVENTVLPPPAPEPIPVTEPAPPTAQANDIDSTTAAALGGIAALGLFGIGFAALRRRKPRRYAAAPKAAPIAEPHREPVPPATPAFAYSTAAFIQPRPQSRTPGGLSHTGASVALPREIPATYDEREALIQRMVDASPDRANPFQSRRARWKRARLIVQSLGRDFAEADPWIDLSQYPSNWPELARRQSAAAA